MNVLPFVQQEHRSQISDAFVGEARRGDQFQTFELEEEDLSGNLCQSVVTCPKWAG